MNKAGQEVPSIPTIPNEETRILRAKLILEECLETIYAMGIDIFPNYENYQNQDPLPINIEDIDFKTSDRYDVNIVEVADGCADIKVVTTGTLAAFGIHADDELQDMIDDSNLDKFGPGGYRRDDGKWIKPPDWKAPDIMGFLKKHGYQEDLNE